MASEALKSVLRDGLPSTLDRYMGGSTGYEPPPGQVTHTGGPGLQDHMQQPVDTTPGEDSRLIAGIDNRVTYAGGAIALVAGVSLLVWAVN